MRVDERDARDGVQLAGTSVQEQLHVRERLESRAEAGLRLPHSLRHRSHAAAIERVQVQDAIGLPVAERPEHDGLGLVGPPIPAKSRQRRRRLPSPSLCRGACETQASADVHDDDTVGARARPRAWRPQSGWQRGQYHVPRPPTRVFVMVA